MRPALSLRWLHPVLLCLCLLVAPASADTVDLTLDQAREVARRALLAADPALAVALALRLLEADPKDPYALLILAAGEQQLGDPAAGRNAGRAAWSAAAGLPGLRYEIARRTALSTLQLGQPLAAAFWLRRAIENAPDTAARTQSLTDLATLRARQRLQFAANLAVTPSTNLNEGASSGFLIIDDNLIVGPLSGSAQALSGQRITGNVSVTYALAAGARSVTRLGLQAFASQNNLSRASRIQAPDLSGSDLNQTTLEVSLGREFVLSEQQSRPASATLALGRSSVGGVDSGPYARLVLTAPLSNGPDWALTGKLGAESHWRDQGRVDAVNLGLSQSRNLASGAGLAWSLSAAQVQGQAVNQDYRSLNADLTYTMGRPFGPVSLSSQISVGLDRYGAYMLGPFQVTNGRSDQNLDLSLTATFQDIQILGYAPTVSLDIGHTWSNISRFETNQVSVTLGYKSLF